VKRACKRITQACQGKSQRQKTEEIGSKGSLRVHQETVLGSEQNSYRYRELATS